VTAFEALIDVKRARHALFDYTATSDPHPREFAL
jgi:hypothetical protein